MADETIPTPRNPGSSRPAAVWQPPSPEEFQSQIPQYKVLDLLGHGGMGAVYKGWQVSLDRYVAIKILPPGIDDGDAHFAERFKQEAKTMARFMHPAIVAVFDAGETTSGLLYIVMEFVEGTDVAQMVKSNGRLPPENALSITAHVCDALHYAHSHGVIHRDIKPANIMVNHEGQVKVADFGLAKANEAACHGLTRTDMSMGTPDYIAPEALMLGVVADHRADLYAVGVMLYNMLTGDIPRGKFKMPSQKVGTDPRFDAIVDKAMEQEREQRYQSAKDIRRDLDVILTTPMEKAPPPPDDSLPTLPLPKGPTGIPAPQQVTKKPPPKKSSAGMISGIVGAAAVIGLGAFFALKKPAETSASGAASSGSIATATKDAPFVNSLGMKFVPVPGTKVLFSVWDTRVEDYAAYAAGNQVEGSWTQQQRNGVPVSRERGYPVVGVSWEDANAFCQWLTEKESAEGKLPKGMKYRLPTDEEWSWAVGLPAELGTTPNEKAGKNSVDFPWGKDWPPPKNAGNYADETFHALFPKDSTDKKKNGLSLENYTDGYATTSPVGSFPANAHGLYDMGGNVWQWCEDWHDASHKYRVLRGSAWDRDDFLVSSARNAHPPDNRGIDVGFRCVLAPATSAAITIPAVSSTPATATKDSPFVNSLGMKFVPVPGTKVLFSEWDTRVKDYTAYARVNKVNGSWTTQQKDSVPVSREPEYPVVGVSWDDANAFCQWLTEKELAGGNLPEGMKYRLPTDVEWSRAVGLPNEEGATPKERSRKNNVDFPWGIDYPPTKARVANYSDAAWHEKFPNEKWIEGYNDGYATTSPVGSFPANVYGLYDMGGNVWQWCEDLFEPAGTGRVLRGACYAVYDSLSLLSSHRHSNPPDTRQSFNGFRCVLAPATPVPAVSSTPATATKDSPFVNSLGMKFVPVPGTKVLFSEWDTRVKDYTAYAAGNQVEGFWTKQQRDSVPVSREPECPVVGVNWEDANAFCQWLTEKESAEGKLPKGLKYRLPTDEEWSWAVGLPPQLGTTPAEKVGQNYVDFPWGKDWPPPKNAGNYADETFHANFPKDSNDKKKDQPWIEDYTDGYATTSPVGSFPANAHGLYDMGGNVSQWCEDWMDASHKYRVLRGSAWSSYLRLNALSAFRNSRSPGNRSNDTGFRCVLAPATASAQ